MPRYWPEEGLGGSSLGKEGQKGAGDVHDGPNLAAARIVERRGEYTNMQGSSQLDLVVDGRVPLRDAKERARKEVFQTLGHRRWPMGELTTAPCTCASLEFHTTGDRELNIFGLRMYFLLSPLWTPRICGRLGPRARCSLVCDGDDPRTSTVIFVGRMSLISLFF